MAANELIDAAAVAKRLGLTERGVRGLVTSRRIPHIRIGPQTVRFDPLEIEAWLEANRRGGNGDD